MTLRVTATDGGADGVDEASDGAGESVRETACWRRAASRSAQVTSRVTATDGGADGVDEASDGAGEAARIERGKRLAA